MRSAKKTPTMAQTTEATIPTRCQLRRKLNSPGLANGEYAMTVRLSPDQWTNVEGERSGAGFAKTLKRVDNIGLTFGGGCFFGHGVSVTGGTAVPANTL